MCIRVYIFVNDEYLYTIVSLRDVAGGLAPAALQGRTGSLFAKRCSSAGRAGVAAARRGARNGKASKNFVNLNITLKN